MLKIFYNWENNFWLFFGVLLVCFAVSVGIRYQQFVTWKKTPEMFFVGERPMMTTLDAPYWLRMAREYNEGTFGMKDYLRNYPKSTETFRKTYESKLSIPKQFKDHKSESGIKDSSLETKNIHYKDIPLLSFLVAHLAPLLNYNYYLTGTLLVPVMASLFILPLGIYFFKIGFPLSGLLGGLIGSFASGYYMRTSIGRIDTDMLNLFFPLIAALLILLSSRAKSERQVLLYSIGVGLSLFFFQWWYNKSGFTWAYFTTLIVFLFVKKIRFDTIILSAFLFVLCSDPKIFMSAISNIKGVVDAYFMNDATAQVFVEKGVNPSTFPNTISTISEANKVQLEEVLRRVLSNTMIVWAGFFGLFWMVLFRWRDFLPLVPLLGLALLSFYSSNRFIMFLAPFIGIGLGWLLTLMIEGGFIFWPTKHSESKQKKGKETRLESKKSKFISLLNMEYVNSLKNDFSDDSIIKKNIHRFKFLDFQGFIGWNWVRQGILYMVMGIFFWVISTQTAISFVPGPSIHTRIYSSFLEVKNRIPNNSVLLTWWDYGYSIIDATGLATFHDGGAQMSPKTYFIARGLISSEPDEIFYITQYLATKGNRGIAENNTSPKDLLRAVMHPQNKPWDPIYLFFTADMTGKYGAISKLGSWDIEKGGSKPRGYQNLACNKITSILMNCRGATIDLRTGKINSNLALRRLIFIRNGQVFQEKKFEHNNGFTLQLIVAGNNIIEVQLIDEEVFKSNYNQMFLLGRYRKDLFEETYNSFPFSRLYRIKY